MKTEKAKAKHSCSDVGRVVAPREQSEYRSADVTPWQKQRAKTETERSRVEALVASRAAAGLDTWGRSQAEQDAALASAVERAKALVAEGYAFPSAVRAAGVEFRVSSQLARMVSRAALILAREREQSAEEGLTLLHVAEVGTSKPKQRRGGWSLASAPVAGGAR